MTHDREPTIVQIALASLGVRVDRVTTRWTYPDERPQAIGREWRLWLWRDHAVSVRHKPCLYGPNFVNFGIDLHVEAPLIVSLWIGLLWLGAVILEYRNLPFPEKRQ